MAKKSAKSKGYRNYKKEEKGFTKKDIRTMCIGLAIIVLVIVCALVLPDFIEAKIYNYLPVKDGAIEGMQDNWLVYNRDSDSSNKYVLRATVDGAAEGYVFDRNENLSDDNYANVMYFKPADDNAEPVAARYYVLAASDAYDEVSTQSLALTSMYADEIINVSEELQDATVGDLKAKYYVLEEKFENTTEETETAETTESTEENSEETEEAEVTYTYVQSVYFFLENPAGDGCFSLCATNSGDSDACFTEADNLVALLTDAAQYITPNAK